MVLQCLGDLQMMEPIVPEDDEDYYDDTDDFYEEMDDD